MNNKRNIIISIIIACIITIGVYFVRDYITASFTTIVPEVAPIDRSDVKGSELFNNLGNDMGDGEGDLGEGLYSYKTLSDTYYNFNSLSLDIASKTEVYENGKLMDSKEDKQIFKYAKKYKIMVKSSENQIYCDGKNVTRYIPQAKTYMSEQVSDNFFNAMIGSSPALNTIGLLTGADYSGRIKEYKYTGKETLEGKNCDVIVITLDGQGQVPDFKQTLWLEEKVGIIIKNYYEITRIMPGKDGASSSEITMKVTNITKNYKINEIIKDSAFKFVPKSGDQKYDAEKAAAEMERQAKLMEQQRKEFEAGQEEINPNSSQNTLNSQNSKPLTEDEKKKLAEQQRKEFEKNSPVNKQTYNFKATGFSPSAFRGKKLIVVFWAYGYGEDYMNTVSNFARTVKGKYEVVTVNINKQSQDLKKHVETENYSVPVYYMDEKSAANAVKTMQIKSLPAIYFIDEIGVTRGVLYGRASLNQLIISAREKLEEKTPKPEEKKTENKQAIKTEENTELKQIIKTEEENTEDNEDISVEIKENPKNNRGNYE